MSKPKKQFDFTQFKQRHIALKILYFGWDYDGLAAQVDSENTIEYHLFQALTKTCLIESRTDCHYNRCGRTDKGVSSYGQVVNLCVRSNLIDENDPNNVGLFSQENYNGSCSNEKSREELNYVATLNRVLPDHIKAIAWAPVRKDFSSRFNCQSRSYSYIFPLGDLCIEAMRDALQLLIGEHDFRNICSFDLKNGVTNHKRTILSAYIEPIRSIDKYSDTTKPSSLYSFYQIVIVGQAFLYHQIRCIMTILFLVGSNKEPSTIISDLLDINKCSSRPNYNRASPMPLCLFNCKYLPTDLPLGWYCDQTAIHNLIRQLKNLWLQYKTKSMMIERVLIDLETISDEEVKTEVGSRLKLEQKSWKHFGLECDNMSESRYIPLLKRSRDETLETKLEIIKNKKNKNIDSPP